MRRKRSDVLLQLAKKFADSADSHNPFAVLKVRDRQQDLAKYWETGWSIAEECPGHGHYGILPLLIGNQLSVRTDFIRIKPPDSSLVTLYGCFQSEIMSPI